MVVRGFPLVRTLRTGVLCLVLAVVAFAVPPSSVQTTDVELVRIKRAGGVSVGSDVIWILAVGSDARPGQDMLHSRGDALQLVGVNTRTDSATAIGVPRDSWVSLPGHGMQKINSALYFGGPEAMAAAMADLIGITPDYVLVTRFPFFEDMVDDIGGIEVSNPRAFKDPYLKKEGFRAGRIHLGGYDAMAFSRIRKELPGGDFDRSANQQRTLRGIHARIRSQADRPGFIERGVMTVLKHMATNVGPAELYELAQAVAQVEPRRITTCVIRGRIGSTAGQSVVYPDVAQARRLGNAARSDATLGGC
ncbi:MAG: LytR family transcriptional regulator [Nocardioides sp.]|jgi:LCP family protein required for cell wall assembly|uniref:LCP family protein n=1 Tax=Nocardioides sp. TaxID=35761 RepID=UPI002609A650|nr:LCP family protein [Nocardioides sp.]MCW2835080.1 LytR family transcriptional regulator [Nocardioides sp.]